MKTLQPLVIISLFVLSCGPQPAEIENLNQPSWAIYEQFGYKPEGEIIFQFYHEYGFTDKILHLITIVKPAKDVRFENSLPLDSVSIADLSLIDTRKFIKGKPIIFTPDYQLNADVSIVAKQYHLNQSDLNVFHESGSYQIKRIGDSEMITLYDEISGLIYLEQKK